MRIANGFLPVKVELPFPDPTRFLVPDDFSLSLIILLAMDEFCVCVYPFSLSLPVDPRLEAEELLVEVALFAEVELGD